MLQFLQECNKAQDTKLSAEFKSQNSVCILKTEQIFSNYGCEDMLKSVEAKLAEVSKARAEVVGRQSFSVLLISLFA